MKRSQILIVVALALLVTGTFYMGRPLPPELHTSVIDELRRLRQLEETEYQLLLRSRWGKLANYDPLVATERELGDSLRALRREGFSAYGPDSPAMADQLASYTALAKDRAAAVERFKTLNSILKNSLAYFPELSASLERTARGETHDEDLAAALGAFRDAVLLAFFTNDADFPSAAMAQLRESALTAPALREELDTLHSHARLILDTRGELDLLFDEILSPTRARQLEGIYELAVQRNEQEVRKAAFYGAVLYAASVGLIAYVCLILVRLTFSSTSLRRANDDLRHRENDLARLNEELRAEIAERKRTEEELVVAKDTAIAADRAKSEFLANMSHELRTPLNAIIGFSDLMRHATFGPLGHQNYSHYTQDINDSAHHLLQIINDVLDIARIEAGEAEKIEHEEVDLERCLESTVRLLRPRAQRRAISVETCIGAGPFRLCGDERRLKQVMLNLLSNAVKFTPDGGKVNVSLDWSASVGMVVRVADTGIGIARGDIGKALVPFGQIDGGLARKYEGSGLGLPIAVAMIQAHDGALTIDSEPGVGTTVSMELPRARVSVGSTPSAPRRAATPPRLSMPSQSSSLPSR